MLNPPPQKKRKGGRGKLAGDKSTSAQPVFLAMFQRLFNWIKFKTLPPSVLFKNRLFLERDSKTRRITHNLGLTFRNSKWTPYARYDIQQNLKGPLGRNLALSLVTALVVFCCVNATTYYQGSWAWNPLTYHIWLLKDLTTYYALTGLSALLHGVRQVWPTPFFTGGDSLRRAPHRATSVQPRTAELKYLYYRWLRAHGSINSWPTSGSLGTTTSQTRSCFTAAGVLAHGRPENLNLNNGWRDVTPSPLTWGLHLTSCLDQPTYKTHSSFVTRGDAWSCDQSLHAGTDHLHYRGVFYGTNFNLSQYDSLGRLGTTLRDSLNFQAESLKTLRFLYNYSTLHRSFLQATHRLTTVKRLLYGSFYDKKFFTKNIWASNTFNLMQNAAPYLKSELDLLYGPTLGAKPAAMGSGPDTQQLSFYEESFFFLTKRFAATLGFSAQTPNLAYLPAPMNLGHSGAIEVSDPSPHLQSSALSNFYLTNLRLLPSEDLRRVAGNGAIVTGRDVQLITADTELLSSDDETLLVDLLQLNPKAGSAVFVYRAAPTGHATNLLLTPQTPTRRSFFAPRILHASETTFLTDLTLR